MGPDPQRPLPVIIQGGMGVGVSSWRLAGAVARRGQLGVVSGTATDLVLARTLQDGDPGGHRRRALEAFPLPDVADRVLQRWFRPGGRGGRPYKPVPRPALRISPTGLDLAVAGAFTEVWLAKEGHGGTVGLNLLEKIQMAVPAAVYGALLAGVDHLLVGAGIPRQIPGLLSALVRHETGEILVDIAGGDPRPVRLDPGRLSAVTPPELSRPVFLAIVSSDVLAAYLCREEATRPDGFVVEGPVAGGHNAPPRGRPQFDGTGQPVYGPRDEADPARFTRLGLPFWLAGGYGRPERVRAALDAGAAGVQVGTLFALCHESGMSAALRHEVIRRLPAGGPEVRTEPGASPTGFPFKVAQLPGTVSDPAIRAARPRLCDLGYLRTPFAKDGGRVGYRCPAEPVADYVRKGGEAGRTQGAICLCNGLTATNGLGQTRADGFTEPPLVTLGSDLGGAVALGAEPARDGADGGRGWSADDALDWLLGGVPAAV